MNFEKPELENSEQLKEEGDFSPEELNEAISQGESNLEDTLSEYGDDFAALMDISEEDIEEVQKVYGNTIEETLDEKDSLSTRQKIWAALGITGAVATGALYTAITKGDLAPHEVLSYGWTAQGAVGIAMWSMIAAAHLEQKLQWVNSKLDMFLDNEMNEHE